MANLTEDFSVIPEGARFNILFMEDAIMGANDLSEKELISFYPNPVTDKVNFNSKSIIGKVSIYDLSGKLISELNSNSNKVEMNLSQLNSDVYIAKIQTKEGIQTIKLIKK